MIISDLASLIYPYAQMTNHWTYIHGGVNLCNSFVLCGELIDLHSITH